MVASGFGDLDHSALIKHIEALAEHEVGQTD
jgi:hypothetical protein